MLTSRSRKPSPMPKTPSFQTRTAATSLRLLPRTCATLRFVLEDAMNSLGSAISILLGGACGKRRSWAARVFERWSPVTVADFVNFALRAQEKFWNQRSYRSIQAPLFEASDRIRVQLNR